MATPIFLYPSLTDSVRESIFQAKKFAFSYTGADGFDRDLDYETSEISSSVNCLRTDGVWSADKNNLFVKRTIALKNYRTLLFFICRDLGRKISKKKSFGFN
ncbi:MAG: hypothetical protein E7223_00420 [Clostridiales bacterium]|nr:hypothetical protein [Clostridiales bacterium]